MHAPQQSQRLQLDEITPDGLRRYPKLIREAPDLDSPVRLQQPQYALTTINPVHPISMPVARTNVRTVERRASDCRQFLREIAVAPDNAIALVTDFGSQQLETVQLGSFR